MDGGYSSWEPWLVFGLQDGGMMTRVRKCNHPLPSKAGKGCGAIGSAKEEKGKKDRSKTF